MSHLGMDLIKSNTLRITLLDGKVVETPVPAAIQDFLNAFNAGDYPELEMSREQIDAQKD